MSRGLITAHTPADCRWSRLGYRLSFVTESEQPETPWVCVREPGTRRPLTDSECAYCEFWEPADEPGDATAQRTMLPFRPE